MFDARRAHRAQGARHSAILLTAVCSVNSTCDFGIGCRLSGPSSRARPTVASATPWSADDVVGQLFVGPAHQVLANGFSGRNAHAPGEIDARLGVGVVH